MPLRSVLLASNYNAWREPFNAQAFEFLAVISSLEDADLVAPPQLSHLEDNSFRPSTRHLVKEMFYRSASTLRRLSGRTRLSNLQPVVVDRSYDLFFFMCQFPHDLAALDNIRGWREKCGTAVAFILESWSSQFDAAKAELRLLDKFDHVFVLNASCIRRLEKYTKAPCRFLATAVDCLLASPLPNPSYRCIDVYSMGRRSAPVHEQLVRLAEEQDFFYMYDTWRRASVIDWRESRLFNYNIAKRSRYFIAFDHARLGMTHCLDERSIQTRYFEGVASGAVVIGSTPECEEFARMFDWEDAVIDIPIAPKDIKSILLDLDSQEDRLARARRNNIVNALRRHDWANRWDEVLKVLEWERTEQLEERLLHLQRLSSGKLIPQASVA